MKKLLKNGSVLHRSLTLTFPAPRTHPSRHNGRAYGEKWPFRQDSWKIQPGHAPASSQGGGWEMELGTCPTLAFPSLLLGCLHVTPVQQSSSGRRNVHHGSLTWGKTNCSSRVVQEGNSVMPSIPRCRIDPESPASQRRELWWRADWSKPRSIGSAAMGKFTARMYFLVSLIGKVFSVADAPVRLSAVVFEEWTPQPAVGWIWQKSSWRQKFDVTELI